MQQIEQTFNKIDVFKGLIRSNQEQLNNLSTPMFWIPIKRCSRSERNIKNRNQNYNLLLLKSLENWVTTAAAVICFAHPIVLLTISVLPLCLKLWSRWPITLSSDMLIDYRVRSRAWTNNVLRQFMATAEKTVSAAAAAAVITLQSVCCLYGETIGCAMRQERTVVIIILMRQITMTTTTTTMYCGARLGSGPLGGRLCVSNTAAAAAGVAR